MPASFFSIDNKNGTVLLSNFFILRISGFNDIKLCSDWKKNQSKWRLRNKWPMHNIFTWNIKLFQKQNWIKHFCGIEVRCNLFWFFHIIKTIYSTKCWCEIHSLFFIVRSMPLKWFKHCNLIEMQIPYFA